MKYFLPLIMLLVGLSFSNKVYSQKLAVKTNLLYDATGTMNLGLEFSLGKKITLDVSGSYNPWLFDKNTTKRINHILVQPEFRYWLDERFNGHFFGIHAHYAYYNVGGYNWLLNAFKTMSSSINGNIKNYRFDGWLAGAGISYGYHWILHKRWSLEGTIGVGYAYIEYDKYGRPVCAEKIGREVRHYFGPTKAGLTLIFMIK